MHFPALVIFQSGTFSIYPSPRRPTEAWDRFDAELVIASLCQWLTPSTKQLAARRRRTVTE